jgi:hypothetical protein
MLITSGERYAVVWAQVAAPGGSGITEVNRVGIRIYLAVAGAARPSRFEITVLTAVRDQQGKPQITAQLHKTGKRAVDVSGTVGLSHGPAGLYTDPAKTSGTTIGPGGTSSVSAVFDSKLPAGPWRVTVLLASGTVHQRSTGTLTFPTIASAAVAVPVRSGPDSHNSTTWQWLWWALGGLALVLTILGGFAWNRARTLRRAQSVA